MYSVYQRQIWPTTVYTSKVKCDISNPLANWKHISTWILLKYDYKLNKAITLERLGYKSAFTKGEI